MERVTRIIYNEEFKRALNIIDDKEQERIYCKHGFNHLLDVARIMYIMNMESGLNYDKEVIYAAALLHDIGRSISDEYHHEESVKMAIHILDKCGFTDVEARLITDAIEAHRNEESTGLKGLLFRADKLSRNCYYCKAQETCKWLKKNEELID